MPIKSGRDSEGCFYQYGETTGKKYHYKCGNELERQKAYDKAREQEQAVISSGYNGAIQLKKWRNDATSSNVDRIMYNDESRELVIKFNGGSVYTYYDVDFDIFISLIEPAALAKTNGENRYGRWWVGKPSVGAGVHRYLSRYKYSRGGSLR